MAVNIVFGYLAALTAVVCFGSYAVPVNSVDTGDGVFFQWVECCSILIVGYIAMLSWGEPYVIDPIAMIGGMLWCFGNISVIPIVNRIGLSLGLLLWGLVNLLTGWSAGTFGIVVSQEHPNIPWLNYVGVFVAAASFALYFPIRVKTKAMQERERQDLEATERGTPRKIELDPDMGVEESEGERLFLVSDDKTAGPASTVRRVRQFFLSGSAVADKVLGGMGSVLAGLLYGFNMIPVQYLVEKNPLLHPLSFAFSHFSGIFLTSTVILVIYAGIKRNKPVVNQQAIIPAMLAGFLWAVGQCGWFVGNSSLGLTVAFPIICTGPALVGSLWGVLWFKEISGKRNLLWLAAAASTTALGIALITASR